METSIKALIPTKTNFKVVTIFAYSSHGVPGIEIIGLGKHSKQLKEKLIYLCKCRSIKFPLKRFVLCLESSEEVQRLNWQYLQWVELPFLILLLNLLELLPVNRLETCFTAGQVKTSGTLLQFNLPTKVIDYCMANNLTLIHEDKHSCQKTISPRELFCDISDLKFKSLEFLLK